MRLRRCSPGRMLVLRARSRIALVLLLTLLALIGAPPAAATNVSGTISVDTTWTLGGSPYVMTGNVTVNAGVTLTIEAGVVVQGDAQTRLLTINGSLLALGSAGAHVTFTSSADSSSGQWTGIRFGSGAGASTLTYADIRNGGGAGISDANGMVDISGGTVTIEDSTISDSSVSGVKIAGGTSGTGASLTMRRTKVEHNGYIGTDTHGDGININNARIVVEDSAFWSNAGRGLNFAALTSSYTPAPSQITGSSIWENDLTGVRRRATGQAR